MTDKEESEFYRNYNRHVRERGVIVQNSVEEYHEKSIKTAKERYKIVKEFFSNKAVLEIGSSTGAFLSLLENCETNACELAKDNLEYSKKFLTGMGYESLEEVNNSSFDVICMFHVFEHIKNPISFLNKCKSLLKHDGIILIEVPHSGDALLDLFNLSDYKDFLFQPMHPMVYNEKSLDQIFSQANLHKQKVIYHQRYGLDNHLSWLINRKPGGDDLLKKLFSSNAEYKDTLIRIKKTDTIYYIAGKDNV